MKKILFAIAAIAFATTAEAKWYEKPVKCASAQEMYDELIDPYELQPMIVAVANIIIPDESISKAVLIFYMNIDTGRYLIIESDNVNSCIIAIGDGIDFDITPEQIRNHLLKKSGTT